MVEARERRLKPLPVGKSDWATFSQTNYTVDKTLLIKELIDDDTAVALFTRPRRFGKTTALNMLRAFFEKTPVDTSRLFRDLKIWAAGEAYRREQGRYPVIYLTFKDVFGMTFDAAFETIRRVMAGEIARHADALDALPRSEDAARLRRVMADGGDVSDCAASLGLLAQAIHLNEIRKNADLAVKPVILIDECDAPVNNASEHGHLPEMTAFMRPFLSGALKDNAHVRMGVLTGVLRVAKAGILSGLNNLDVWTVFDRKYNAFFGFTEGEVAEMARYYGVEEKMPEIRAWYDGYNFAGAGLYNPWSVLKYFKGYCEPKPYWLDTSSNAIIAEIVRDLPHDTVRTLEALLSQGRALVPMTGELGPYAEIRNRPETLYALLVSAGYLKVVPPATAGGVSEGLAWVAIPNRELETVFVNDILSKVRRSTPRGESDDILRALAVGDAGAFRDAMRSFLTESVSYFDAATEGFYHGLTLGFLAMLRKRFKVRSNRESGAGRFDIALSPLVSGFPGVIIEVKAAKAETDDLMALAQDARDQIDARGYAAEMTAEGVGDILKLGLAYYKKTCELCT